jgi:prolipoprotein diacylglyceryltransferase
MLWLYRSKDLGRRRPGALIGASMACIFIARFFIEFIKERQVDFESGMTLDMGQWLSLPFIAIGIYLVVRAFLRPEVTDLNAVVERANREYAKEDKKKGKKK